MGPTRIPDYKLIYRGFKVFQSKHPSVNLENTPYLESTIAMDGEKDRNLRINSFGHLAQIKIEFSPDDSGKNMIVVAASGRAEGKIFPNFVLVSVGRKLIIGEDLKDCVDDLKRRSIKGNSLLIWSFVRNLWTIVLEKTCRQRQKR